MLGRKVKKIKAFEVEIKIFKENRTLVSYFVISRIGIDAVSRKVSGRRIKNRERADWMSEDRLDVREVEKELERVKCEIKNEIS